MTGRLTCPSCHAHLRVPATIREPTISCPSCLAEVANPNVAVSAAPPAAGPAPAPDSVICPACGHTVEGGWRFCPYCQEILHVPDGDQRSYSLEGEVRRDTRRTSVGLVLLAVLGGLQLVGALVQLIVAGTTEALALGLGFLLLLILIVTGIMFVRTRHNPQDRSIGRVVVGTLALVGGLSVAWIALALAVVVFFFAICAVAGGLKF